MAYVFTRSIFDNSGKTILAEWNDLDNLDVADILVVTEHPDMTVQVLEETSGTPTVTFEGSLNYATDASPVFFPLTDSQGVAISFTSPGGSEVLQSPVLIRPVVAAGGATIRVKAIRK